MDTLNFTVTSFKELKKLYNKAVKENKQLFIFQGKELLTSYAKYLIEYLEPKFKDIK